MPATSLAEQLQKLSVPQTSIYKDDKKRASLLFDPKEAALKDRDTFYDIGISGLKELIALYEGFRVFEDGLFSVSSKDFERAVQSKEVNQNLNRSIEKFLLQLSPYFLLQSAHKALEWLVNRYQIHDYNQDAIMALILPYHETKIFIRFIQLFDIKSDSNKWNWLQSVQKNGIPLTKQVLYNQCVSNMATLQFVSDTTLKYVNEFSERASQLNTVFAFLCSTVIGTINTSKHVTESIISALLPTIVKGLASTVKDFRSSAYIILGFLVTKTKIKHKTLLNILDVLLSTEFDLSYDSVLLINLIYSNQIHLRKMTESILDNITVSVMHTICLHLKKLVEYKINIQAFVIAFLSSVLPLIQKDIEEFRKLCQFPEILIDEVDLKNQQPEKIVRCILHAYHHQKESNAADGNESDVEIIEEQDAKILHWYCAFLRSVERKYPEVFDKVVKHEMSSESKISDKRRAQLSKILGFKPAVAHKIGGKYLFENLNHVNPELRVEAINYIAREFHSLTSENKDFVKDAIVNRLNDENINVVLAALDIPNEYLVEVLDETDLTKAFATIISKGSKKWRPVIETAISKFCSLEILPVNQDTILAVVPLLFPYDSKSAQVTWKIITSPWGKKFGLLNNIKDINSSLKDNAEVLKQRVFKIIFLDRVFPFSDKLDFNLVKKDSTLDLFMYMLLKSCSFKQASLEEITSVLDTLLDSIVNRVIVSSNENTDFSADTITEFIKVSNNNKILFQIMEYILTRIVEDMKVKNISRPWCNVCATPETVLIRRLYEIFITGCGIPTYTDCYAKLLQKLLNKFCSSAKDKFDFIANIAFGHILYAANPKDVISPELQLRSLKLLSNFFAVQQNATWAYDSDVLILTLLFNLNHPITPIRQFVIELTGNILREEPDKKFIYIQLLKELMTHKDEMLLDHEQLPQVLKTILTEQSPGNKLFRKNCLLRLTRLITSDTSHVNSALLKLLAHNNNSNMFSLVVPALNRLENKLKKHEDNRKFLFDIYDSNIMKTVFSLINENTVSTFIKDEIWCSIETALKEYRECVVLEDQSLTSPCVLVMKEIEENVFAKFPDERRRDLVRLITAAGAFSNNPSISSIAYKTMKKISIKFEYFKNIFENMLNALDPVADTVSKKKKSTMSMLSHQVVETDEWRLGVTLLEYVQSKKKMSVDTSFVNMLFQILNKCLRFEEQSHVEYTKQLILTSLWYFCKKFVDDTDKEQLKSLKSMFDVETIVQCIRGTQNPQTQHHALILLSHAAYMLPEQVLHHTMEIFTFMGYSVLRHDDGYSFQIITKIIETLIPILVKLDKNVEDYTEMELQLLQKRAVPVLRIFADVVLHVPEHRRLPLYKKLIETLGPSQFLWVFLALLLETHVAHFKENKNPDRVQQRSLASLESPINRLDFGQSILLEFSPEISLENFIKLMNYIKSLPLQKNEDEMEMEMDIDPSEIFSVNGHTPIQLRHYKYVIVTFMNNYLASSRFIQHSCQATDIKTMESHYKTFIINILTYIQSISKISDEKTAKYWRVMLHHSYDLLDHTNNLLSAPMFLSVIRGLMRHTLPTVRRKSMELLNSKIQFSPEFFDDVNKELLFSLLPVLLDIVKTVENTDDNLNESTAQDQELNQQTALLSLKLLTRMLASENPEPFKPVLEAVTDYTCNHNICENVMASIVLSLAELCANLKAHALSSLRRFMPALIKVLKKQRKADTPELVLLSTVTAISKIVESLPLFLSPYLQKILYEYSILLAKWQSYDQECAKVSAIVSKLMNIKKKIAGSIPPRVLIPVANETHQLILEKENYDAVGPVMAVLADSFANVTTADFTALQHDLTAFFLTALQLRSDAVEKNIDTNVIDRAEDEVVKALVALVLKLSETNFRPFYFKIYDWAIRTNIDGQKDRTITFYRLSSAIADKLKGLFVLFAGHFIKNAADLLDSCNTSKTESLYFDSEDKCVDLVNYILKTLHIVFLYDSQNFLNKDRFETLMQPVVDQLENPLRGVDDLKTRAEELIIPCIAQFAVAIADDSLWKLLNYQILLKSRHNDPEIRLITLDCLVSMATQLGSNWLPLLAESVPFLAELLEDGDQKIETATKDAIRKLEQILGEPLEKYF